MYGLSGFVAVAHEIEESDVTDFQDPTAVDGGERLFRRSAVVIIESTIAHDVEGGLEVRFDNSVQRYRRTRRYDVGFGRRARALYS